MQHSQLTVGVELRRQLFPKMQVECIQELRNMEEKAEEEQNGGEPEVTRLSGYEDLLPDGGRHHAVEDALIITIKGIAAGMQNTG